MKYLVKNKKVFSTENWEERMGEITIEEFAEENGFEVFDDKPSELLLQEKISEIEKELKQINIWFQQNDYIPNKVLTGEWEATDKRWTDYLKERAAKRKRQDELKEMLGV